MRLAASSLALGWALLTAGIAALTTPWAWALSAGLVLIALGMVAVVAEVRDLQATPPVTGGAK